VKGKGRRGPHFHKGLLITFHEKYGPERGGRGPVLAKGQKGIAFLLSPSLPMKRVKRGESLLDSGGEGAFSY